MKVGAFLAALVLACGALAATYWIARSGTAAPDKAATGVATPGEPTPSKTGPHPKAVVPETKYEFGVMLMGETDEHEFVIRNEGKAPLLLGTPQTTCQCTVSEAAKKPIPPGGEGTVKLKWTPAAETEMFDKGAMIRTNDPKMPEIRLSVVGKVEPLLVTSPEGTWTIGDVTGRDDVEVAGYIYSRLLDDFKIESIESSNPLLQAEALPVGEEELKEQDAKAAYKIKASLSPGMPVGKFKETLTIKTDIKDNEKAAKFEIPVQGTRQGPIQLIPTPGVRWNPEAFSIDLGQFAASEGASATLSLFVIDPDKDTEFKFESVDSTVRGVEVELKRDQAAPEGDSTTLRIDVSRSAWIAAASPPCQRRGKGGGEDEPSRGRRDAVHRRVHFSAVIARLAPAAGPISSNIFGCIPAGRRAASRERELHQMTRTFGLILLALVAIAVVVLLVVGGSAMFSPREEDGRNQVADDDDPADDKTAQPPRFNSWPKPAAVLVLTGEEHGYLEPCGCSEKQSGGMAHRSSLVKQLRGKEWDVAGLGLGGTVKRARKQTQYKFSAITDALRMLDYRGLGLGPEELRLQPDFLISEHVPADDGTAGLAFLGANETFFGIPDLPGGPQKSVIFELGGVKIGAAMILGESKQQGLFPEGASAEVAFTPPTDALEGVVQQFADEGTKFNVLLSYADQTESRSLAKAFPQFNVVVSAGGPEDPNGEPEQIGDTLFVTVGHKGKYVGVLGLYPDDAKQPLRYELVELDADRFEHDPALDEIMREYQNTLADNLSTVFADLPEAPAPGGGTYVGATKCGECHKQAFAKWSGTKHAAAYHSLAKGRENYAGSWVDRSRDPECLSCHVTGWNPQEVYPYLSGFLPQEIAAEHSEPHRFDLLAGPAMRKLSRPRQHAHDGFREVESGLEVGEPERTGTSESFGQAGSDAGSRAFAATTTRTAPTSSSKNTGRRSITEGCGIEPRSVVVLAARHQGRSAERLLHNRMERRTARSHRLPADAQRLSLCCVRQRVHRRAIARPGIRSRRHSTDRRRARR